MFYLSFRLIKRNSTFVCAHRWAFRPQRVEGRKSPAGFITLEVTAEVRIDASQR